MLSELKDVISLSMCKKLAVNEISCDKLKKIFDDRGDKAVVQFFTEKLQNNKVRITKKKGIINKVLDFLKKGNSSNIRTIKPKKIKSKIIEVLKKK